MDLVICFQFAKIFLANYQLSRGGRNCFRRYLKVRGQKKEKPVVIFGLIPWLLLIGSFDATIFLFFLFWLNHVLLDIFVFQNASRDIVPCPLVHTALKSAKMIVNNTAFAYCELLEEYFLLMLHQGIANSILHLGLLTFLMCYITLGIIWNLCSAQRKHAVVTKLFFVLPPH